jgi:CBS domain containing-hemolysin-like protein
VLIAVVTDPTGALVGAVTLEDLLEAFVGEIRDEHDGNEIPPIVRGSDGRFELDGGVTLDVVTRELDFTLPDVPEGVETIGGYVRRRLMHAPHVGDVLEAGGVRLVVFEVSQRRIVRLTGQRHVLGATGASPGGERSSSVMEQ